jgi:hypothetical protein
MDACVHIFTSARPGERLQGGPPKQSECPTRSSTPMGSSGRVAGVSLQYHPEAVKRMRIAVTNAISAKLLDATLRIDSHSNRMIVLHDKRYAATRCRGPRKTSIFLFEQTFRPLAQGLDHQSSILIKNPVGPAILLERVV